MGISPDDDLMWSYDKLSDRKEINDGVVCWGMESDGRLLGFMDIQDKGDVTLIRHAYVLTQAQNQGIGKNQYILKYRISVAAVTPAAGLIKRST